MANRPPSHRGAPGGGPERDDRAGPDDRAAGTAAEYAAVVQRCRAVFERKLDEYGPAWRMFRLVSVVDQIYIKARRIRQLQEDGHRARVDDGIADEYVGIVNYAAMAMWHAASGDLDLPPSPDDLVFEAIWSDPPAAGRRLAEELERTRATMERKNHDYGEAWRDMAPESLVDEILSRTVRIRSLIAASRTARSPTPHAPLAPGQLVAGANTGHAATEAAAKIDSQLVDVVNYAIFALIRLGEPASVAPGDGPA